MLNWNNAKQATFSYDERETDIIIDNETTSITTSQPKIITKIINQYSEEYDVQVIYYGISSSDGSKYPTEVRVTIPLTNLMTFRSLSAIGKISNPNLGKQ